MELVSTKILVLTLLGVVRLFFGLVPLKITKNLKLWGESASHKLVERRRVRVDAAITLCLCFGGGVLLGTCFIHMIPEVRETIEAVKRTDSSVVSHDTSFPFAEFLICCGFFLVYVIEEVVHRLFVYSGHSEHCTYSTPPQCCSAPETEVKNTEGNPGDKFTFRDDTDVPVSAKSRPRSGGKIASASSQIHLIASSLSLDQGGENSDEFTLPWHPTVFTVASGSTCHSCDDKAKSETLRHYNSGFASHTINQESMVGSLRRFLVVVALCFHSLFEGFAIGLQETQRDVWYLFAAVIIQACAILFCIGLELVTSGIRLLNLVLYIVTLSLVSPLGVAVGILMTVHSSSGGPLHGLVVAVLQGIAGGIILYITFFEVLDREKRRESGCGIVRIVFILVGFFLMVALQLMGELNVLKCQLNP